jgi:hypothetical protein
VHNLVVIASRRSGSTFLWNCIFDLVRTRWPDCVWEREFEPFEWGRRETRAAAFDPDRDGSRKRHSRVPLFVNDRFRSPELEQMLTSSADVKIIKINAGLGRAPAIWSYPNTTVIHLVRNPEEVLSSLRHERRFDVASDWPVYLGQYAPWLPLRGEWLVRNAIRWAHDNWAAKGWSDLVISYNRLIDDAQPLFDALNSLISDSLSDQLGEGKQGHIIEKLCSRVRRSTREIRLTSEERFLVKSICSPVWEALVT